MSPVAEHPLFVPVQADHIAAVLAVPEAQARGLVLLLPAFGVGRSHKTRIWTLVARALAERDIASIRVDYRGHGDSTGSVEVVEFATPAIDEAVAAADMGKRLVGVETVGVVGNCYGTRTAVSFAEHRDDCPSVALILPGGFTALFLPRVARTEPTPGNLAAPLLRALRRGPSPSGRGNRLHFIPEVGRALASTDLLFVLPAMEDRRRALQDAIDEVAATNGKEHRGRIGVETIQTSNVMSANLPVEAQPALVAILADWMDQTMPGRASEPGPAVRADAT